MPDPGTGDTAEGNRQRLLLSSERQAAGCRPGSHHQGSIAHQDPINGRNCFVKYQTLMARPDIGNRFICVAGCCLLFLAFPFPPAAESGLSWAGKTPVPKLKQTQPRTRAKLLTCFRGLSHPRCPHIPLPTPALTTRPPARGQAAMLRVAQPRGKQPQGTQPPPAAPEPPEESWTRSTVYSFFNNNPNCNTAIKCP